MRKEFYVYILTNPKKSKLYVGFTNNILRRLYEHYDERGQRKTYAGRMYCYKLIYFEVFHDPLTGIAREKQIKRWSRKKKEALIGIENPKWHSLNKNVGFEFD